MRTPNKNAITLVALAVCFVLGRVGSSNADSEVGNYQFWPSNVLGKRAMQLVRDHLARRQERRKSRTSKQICYDDVGCFPMPRSAHSPLMKSPQPPEAVNTTFLMITRLNRKDLTVVTYGDDHASLMNSSFKPESPTKIIVHGFKGSGRDKVALLLGNALLDLEDSNVVLVDWEKGAVGPAYALAAANTQLIGRQLALLITDMVHMDSDPAHIHVIGFSLGAHVAGFAGKALKQNGITIGRITGLDPASPLFRQMLSSSLSSLGPDDADFVDVVHTDGARVWSEGFGLFHPIGDVDYFPNGGLDQPGCEQVRGSVIVSRFESSMNSSVVCNHLRALQFFLESLKSLADPDACQFTAFPCPAGWSVFQKGSCFPTNCTESNCVTMGFTAAQSKLRGPLYLTTRDSSPFCGRQLKASVLLSPKTPRLRGHLQMALEDGPNSTANFRLRTEHAEHISGGLLAEGISVSRFQRPTPRQMTVELSFQSLAYQTETETASFSIVPVLVDRLSVFDTEGNIWSNCDENAYLSHVSETTIYAKIFVLSLFAC
ncbi:pancreatic triacylglycerol lipase-like isoform X2 [Adelges cooleyi]|nr:pancreatic triacylglycerol lipase-like isoform X2 [Adelges cooleyi]XP_050435763.1 pancreatic triacylglycerol lipase-like isoform X2 [Adelges cooleyi]XP_050435764.1 pancreatic triacylglycerol lipase-like isoform X2 [Adelges cooleyi]XP_050435765.1 pancreatic triacylglycerol lipase-like isoform X2 [Adelges cooleyi]